VFEFRIKVIELSRFAGAGRVEAVLCRKYYGRVKKDKKRNGWIRSLVSKRRGIKADALERTAFGSA